MVSSKVTENNNKPKSQWFFQSFSDTFFWASVVELGVYPIHGKIRDYTNYETMYWHSLSWVLGTAEVIAHYIYEIPILCMAMGILEYLRYYDIEAKNMYNHYVNPSISNLQFTYDIQVLKKLKTKNTRLEEYWRSKSHITNCTGFTSLRH